ncbi:hypothetical protein HZB96_00705 [Candidatus Gottesmanbacteria bacterium]|nr:hypothetical protein [Candidatus Gottesmanbacteria bacterium]
MLTKKDLLNIDKQLNIDKKLDKKLAERLSPIHADIKTIKTNKAKIRKDMSGITDFFDQEYIGLRKRVERIEDHLNLPPIQ